jgi:hypothetical protein
MYGTFFKLCTSEIQPPVFCSGLLRLLSNTLFSHPLLQQNGQSALLDSKCVILTNHESFSIFLEFYYVTSFCSSQFWIFEIWFLLEPCRIFNIICYWITNLEMSQNVWLHNNNCATRKIFGPNDCYERFVKTIVIGNVPVVWVINMIN